MITKDESIIAMDEADKSILANTFAVINEIMIRNNLDLSAAIVDKNGCVVVRTDDIYNQILHKEIGVRTRKKGKP